MTKLSAEILATILRRILDRGQPMQADLEDVLLAERTTEILSGEGFDPEKVFKASSEFAFAIRLALFGDNEAAGADFGQALERGSLSGDELRAMQEALI
jgi:hypothetical protein